MFLTMCTNTFSKPDNCSHMFCNDCWYNYLSTKIDEGNAIKIKCMESCYKIEENKRKNMGLLSKESKQLLNDGKINPKTNKPFKKTSHSFGYIFCKDTRFSQILIVVAALTFGVLYILKLFLSILQNQTLRQLPLRPIKYNKMNGGGDITALCEMPQL